MVPLEISVETFSTGKVNSLGEEAISENTFFPSPLPDPYHLQATMRKLKKSYNDKWETLAQKHFHTKPKQINNTPTK